MKKLSLFAALAAALSLRVAPGALAADGSIFLSTGNAGDVISQNYNR